MIRFALSFVLYPSYLCSSQYVALSPSHFILSSLALRSAPTTIEQCQYVSAVVKVVKGKNHLWWILIAFAHCSHAARTNNRDGYAFGWIREVQTQSNEYVQSKVEGKMSEKSVTLHWCMSFIFILKLQTLTVCRLLAFPPQEFTYWAFWFSFTFCFSLILNDYAIGLTWIEFAW